MRANRDNHEPQQQERYDNALAESFVATLKTECFGDCIPPTKAAVKTMVFDYIETFYNTRRRHSALAREWPLAAEQFVKHRAERIHVRLRCERYVFPARLCGRHVIRRAHDLPRLRQFGVESDATRDAEIRHVRFACGIEQDVAGLDVTLYIHSNAMYMGSMIGKELVAASTEPLILSLLAKGESYGYELIQEVKELSGDQIKWTDGMLYPVLHRMEDNGWIKSRWVEMENGRRRKYYSIKKDGHQALKDKREQWTMISSLLGGLWKGQQHV